MRRYAIVRGARTRREAEAYLPDNYRVIHEDPACRYAEQQIDGSVPELVRPLLVFVIEGEDAAGWTLDGYVIPRYRSGLLVAEEIDLSHPVMKEIPT